MMIEGGTQPHFVAQASGVIGRGWLETLGHQRGLVLTSARVWRSQGYCKGASGEVYHSRGARHEHASPDIRRKVRYDHHHAATIFIGCCIALGTLMYFRVDSWYACKRLPYLDGLSDA
jgi:hypothetical protein